MFSGFPNGTIWLPIVASLLTGTVADVLWSRNMCGVTPNPALTIRSVSRIPAPPAPPPVRR